MAGKIRPRAGGERAFQVGEDIDGPCPRMSGRLVPASRIPAVAARARTAASAKERRTNPLVTRGNCLYTPSHTGAATHGSEGA
jgi:hypothetical protein